MDRWEAHKKGLLHRAFTLTILFENHILLQHRKHPVFDFTFDTTISSHPYFEGDKLMSIEQALLSTLEREWNITQNELKTVPAFCGSFMYREKDPESEYIEHEICHVYTCEVSKLLLPNKATAYGFTVLKREQIKNKKHFSPLLAPWVNEMIKHDLL
jgi:isopentenyldiphosphate isomerase